MRAIACASNASRLLEGAFAQADDPEQLLLVSSRIIRASRQILRLHDQLPALVEKKRTLLNPLDHVRFYNTAVNEKITRLVVSTHADDGMRSIESHRMAPAVLLPSYHGDIM